MLEDKLRDLKKAIDTKRAEVQEKRKAFDAERKKLADSDADITDPAVIAGADEAMKPYSKAAEELRTLEGQFERLALMQADGGDHTLDVNAENEHDRSPLEARESFGRQVVQSDQYKALAENGRFFESGLKAELGEAMDRDKFAALLTSTSDPAGGVLNVPQRFPGIVDLPRLPLGIFDLLTVGTTDSNAVEYVRLLARTINAAEVTEASTTADLGGAVTAVEAGSKPESGLTFEEVVDAVKTIAHWIPATRNTLADASFLATLIDSEIRQGVERRAETQVMQGNGTGANIKGLYAQTGIASYTQGTTVVGEPPADAIHRSYTQLRLAGFEPTGTAIHPNDWQEIRLGKDANGNYQFGPPSIAGDAQIWGVSAVQTIGATAKQPLSGEWGRALFLIREAVKVLVSDSHKDWFTRNMVAILGEMRGVLVVPRPQAFGKAVLL
jgi:HK97 family phage major capsid protein